MEIAPGDTDVAGPRFADLLKPLTVDDFFDRYLDQAPLHLTDRPLRCAELFSWKELEDLAFRDSRNLSSRNLRVFRLLSDGSDGRPRAALDELTVPQAAGFDLSGWMRARYREGYTFYFKQLHRCSKALAELVQHLQLLLNCEVTVSAYLTPPRARGLPGHWDSEDVLILQIDGAKHWRLYTGDWGELPVHRFKKPPPPGPDALHIHMRPGDLLYLPRGVAHEPSTRDEPSLHLTFGIYPCRWMDLLKTISDRAADFEPLLRQRVPLGPGGAWGDEATLAQQLSQALDALLHGGAMDSALLGQRRTVLESSTIDGPVFDRAGPGDALTDATLLRRAADCVVMADGEQATISFAGCTIAAPLPALNTLRFVSRATAPFTVGDMPDAPDPATKRALAARLVADGLLRLASPSMMNPSGKISDDQF